MLNPQNDRFDYGQLLAPPEGYLLDFAVGTTYSLDLHALIGACFALGLSQETDTKLINDPCAIFMALKSTGDKLALFCDAGQIYKPNDITKLYVLFEKIVFQVNTEKYQGVRGYPSFHPKFWLIRYIDHHGKRLYRILILSRNLTFDRSGDVVFSMEGSLSDSPEKKNEPIEDFLTFLLDHLRNDHDGEEKKEKIRSMIMDLPFINFEIDCPEFDDFDFIPSGIKSKNNIFHSIRNYPLFQNENDENNENDPKNNIELNEIFIMSPFLSNDTIKYFNDRYSENDSTEYLLITRKEALEKLNPQDCCHFKDPDNPEQWRIFVMKDAVIFGDYDNDNSDNDNSNITESEDVKTGKFDINTDATNETFYKNEIITNNEMFTDNTITTNNKIAADLVNTDENNKTVINEKDQYFRKQDIHAKVYLTRKGEETDLYLGSLNATHNAVFCNIEFMIRLRSQQDRLDLKKLSESLFNGKEDGPDNPFQQASLDHLPSLDNSSMTDESEEKVVNQLADVVKQITRLHPRAVITAASSCGINSPDTENSLFDIAVHFDDFQNFQTNYKITLCPATLKKPSTFAKDLFFSGLTITQISEFYLISVSDSQRTIQRLIIIPTEGMPEQREKAVVSSVIKDEATFCQCLAYLLGDHSRLHDSRGVLNSEMDSDPESNVPTDNDSSNVIRQNRSFPALYEKMLVAVADNKDCLKKMEYLFQNVSGNFVLLEQYKELFETFRKAVDKL